MQAPLSQQQIIHLLDTYYGIPIIQLTLLPLGADSNATLYKAIAKDQTSYFVKIKLKTEHDIGSEIVDFLYHSGIKPIIPIIKTLQNKTAQDFENLNIMLYPFIQGENCFKRELNEKQWIELGETLKLIHEIKIPHSLQAQLRRENFSNKWRERVRSFYPLIKAKSSNNDMAIKLLSFMHDRFSTIQKLVDRAAALADTFKDQSYPLVLCHADIHAGNILIDQNNMYIVDWDEPMLAPKERDLMFIGGGVGNVWNKPYEAKLFYQGYGKTEINRELLAYYRYERIVQDIAEFAQHILLQHTAHADSAIMYEHFIGMFAPDGVIDIAFQT